MFVVTTLVGRVTARTLGALFVVAASMVLAGVAPSAAAAQQATPAALSGRSVDQLQAERGQVAALIADIENGNTYITDPRMGLYGPEQGNYLTLPVPVDREELSNSIVLSMMELGSPDTSGVRGYFREVQETTRQSLAALAELKRSYDDAIRLRTGGGQPVDTSDQDALARQAVDMTDEECIQAFGRPCDRTERKFDPNDHQSVEAYLNTSWQLQVQGPGGGFQGNLRVEYVHCEPADDMIAAVSCDFNGLLYVEGRGTTRVQNGMYIGGELRMVLYLDGANATLEGALSPETGDMSGSNIRIVGPAATELGLPSGGTWRASR